MLTFSEEDDANVHKSMTVAIREIPLFAANNRDTPVRLEYQMDVTSRSRIMQDS